MKEAEDSLLRPLCKCHAEPMLRNGTGKGKQKWVCVVTKKQRWQAYYDSHAEQECARAKRNYDALTGVEFNLLLLKMRRRGAIRRMRKRKERIGPL